METLLQKALKTFYQDLAIDCYWAYLNGDANITAEDVAELFLPLCKIVTVSHLYWVPEAAWDDMFAEAYVEIYRAVKEKRCQRNVYAYFFGLIRNTLNTKAKQYVHFMKPKERHDGDAVIHSPFPSTKDIHHKMFLDELPSLIRHKVLSSVRFKNYEYQACRYILNRILMGKRIVYFVLQNRYHIEQGNFKFFEDYVIILCREALFSIKRDLTFTIEEDDFSLPMRSFLREEIGYDESQDSRR